MKLILLLNILLLNACVPQAQLKTSSTVGETGPHIEVTYDLASVIKYDGDGHGYVGCSVPSGRGFSVSTSYVFYQDGNDIQLEIVERQFSTMTCTFGGQLPTTLFNGYYRVASSFSVGTDAGGDKIKLVLQSLDWDNDLNQWVDSPQPAEEKIIVLNRTTESIFVEKNSPGIYDLELILY